MRYLAILLLAPWLLILGWAYWAYPRQRRGGGGRRALDGLVLVLAAALAVMAAVHGFDSAALPVVAGDRPASGAIWRQVLPALVGYGVFVGVLALGLWLRHLLFGGRRR